MEKRHTESVAAAVGRSPTLVRQMLRVLREADLLPGHGLEPTSRHIARIVMALGTDLASHVVPLVTALQSLPRAVPAALPDKAEDMLASLIHSVPISPVFGGAFDIDEAFIHIGADSVSLECLTIAGHRVVIRYGAPLVGIAPRVTVPIAVVRNLISAIRNTK